MKNQKWLLSAALLAFIVLLFGATLLYNSLAEQNSMDNLAAISTTTAASDGSSAPDETEPAYSPAPDFTVTDRDGKPVKLSELVGKPVILNFWASWCGPCKSEMPDLEAAYLQYGEDIHFMMVNATDGSRETVDTASSYIDGQGYTFPIYFDTTLEASIKYGASSIPLTYFIDADGNLIARAVGALDAASLQSGIEMILPK